MPDGKIILKSKRNLGEENIDRKICNSEMRRAWLRLFSYCLLFKLFLILQAGKYLFAHGGAPLLCSQILSSVTWFMSRRLIKMAMDGRGRLFGQTAAIFYEKPEKEDTMPSPPPHITMSGTVLYVYYRKNAAVYKNLAFFSQISHINCLDL